MSHSTEPRLHDPRPPEPAAAATAPGVAEVLALTELPPSHGADPRANGKHHPASPLLGALDDGSSPLRHIKASLTVCVGSVQLTVGELLSARDQQVLRLDRSVDQPVDLLLEGHVVARGTLVAVDDHFGVRITELPSAAGPGPRAPTAEREPT